MLDSKGLELKHLKWKDVSPKVYQISDAFDEVDNALRVVIAQVPSAEEPVRIKLGKNDHLLC